MPKVQTTVVFRKVQEAKEKGYTTVSAQGSSRCFASGTMIRMYDGKLKAVEDIIVGDKVMSATGFGYNTVIDTHSGIDEMYLVHQPRGIDYTVNSKHLISTRQTRAKQHKVAIEGFKSAEKRRTEMLPYDKDIIYNYEAEYFCKQSKNFQCRYTGFKNTLIELPEKELPIEPYYLGIWLGDGASCRINDITNTDKEIIEYFYEFAKSLDTYAYRVNEATHRFSLVEEGTHNKALKGKTRELRDKFKNLNLLNNKHIPDIYIYNSLANRLKLLAGLIDSDGYLTKRNTYKICQKRECIVDAVVELCHICGFYTAGKRTSLARMKRSDGSVYECTVYSVEFNHKDFRELNKYMKVERKKIDKKCDRNYYNSSIQVTPVGKGRYYGFTLDNSPYFLLSDGTVCHNSSKTYNIVLWLIVRCINHPNTSVSIVRKTLPSIRRSVERDFKEIVVNLGMWKQGSYNKSELIYNFDNGSFIEFFSADNEQKLRGSKRKILYVNEGNELTFIEWQQLQMRTTDFSIVDYNPSFTDEHWLVTLNREPSTYHFISTYKDNPFLEKKVIDEIESLQYKNKSLWNIYGLGLQAVVEGLVFDNMEVVETIPNWCKRRGWIAIDYGYTNDPTSINYVYITDDTIYIDEICYATKMLTEDIIQALKSANRKEKRNFKIISECADPRMVDEIYNANLDIHPVHKFGGSVMAGITKMLEYKIKITKQSVNAIKEFKNYTYRQDKEGRWLNEPIDAYNHCFTGDTEVITPEGKRRIDTISIGDSVLTPNGFFHVGKVFTHRNQEVWNVRLEFDNLSIGISATPNHLFKTTKGWKRLDELKLLDVLYVIDGSVINKESVLTGFSKISEEVSDVYDLHIDFCHQFFANGVLVHNCIDSVRYVVLEEIIGGYGGGLDADELIDIM